MCAAPLASPAAAAVLRRVDREPRAAHLHAARPGFPRATRTPIQMAKDHPGHIERGLQLKKIGNEICRSSADGRSTR